MKENKVIISLDNLINNYKTIKNKVGLNTIVAPTIKADAYGVGSIEIVDILLKQRLDSVKEYSSKKLEQYSQQLLVEVRFIGSSNIVDEYLHSADCFILFSKNEGLPIAIIEAMREGLPIISTSIAGIPELINDGENGYLIELDELKLSNLLLKIAVERPNLRHMGEASRKLFNEKFTKEQMILSYSKIMKK